MTNKANIIRFLSLSLAIAGFVLVSGSLSELNAQRDPFSRPAWARKKEAGGKQNTGKKPNGPPVDLGIPAITARIEYYKRLRETAAANGQAIPKVTSVLALSEMSVNGIFRTPRGYAAMVEAVPLKLTYTIYPGEKFFDGQLVAVEENRLVFRRVVKMSNGKFVSSVENKPLRKYSDVQQVQGIAPTEAQASADTTTPPRPTETQAQTETTGPNHQPVGPIVSPLEEMNKQPANDAAKDKPKKDQKKPVKVAKSR
jgi:hypothetical protein